MFATINSVTIKRRRLKMKSIACDEDIFYKYPSKEEIKAAQLACCGHCCDVCETPVEYAWRKRGVDMALLLENAIENELSAAEKLAVRNHWFESMSVGEIAAIQGISTAAVSVTLKRAQGKLHKALRYAVAYQNNVGKDSAVSLVLARARVIAAARNSTGDSLPERLHALRVAENLSREALGKVSSVSAVRYAAIESGRSEPHINELVALSETFGVTTDYLLKGEKS